MGTDLSSSEKAAPRRLEGKSGCIQVCNKGSRQSEHQRSGIKLRNSAFSVWEDASLWAHQVHSFHMLLSSLGLILFPCSLCFLHIPSSSSITVGGGNIHRITVWGALIHIWRPEITDGCDISCFLIAYILNSLFTLRNGSLSGWLLLAFPRVPQQSPS